MYVSIGLGYAANYWQILSRAGYEVNHYLKALYNVYLLKCLAQYQTVFYIHATIGFFHIYIWPTFFYISILIIFIYISTLPLLYKR